MGNPKLLVLILIIISLCLRFYKLDQVPASLYYDEIDYGLQARSLIETGKDYRGEFSPFYVHSFNDIRAPIPAYFTTVSTLIFTSPELQVRGANALLGSLVVVLIFYLIKFMMGKNSLAFLAGLIFTTNPWQIQFSRFNHEVMSMAALYLLALLIFYRWLKFKNFLLILLSVIIFSLTVYTYRTMSFYIPLTLVMLFLIYRQEILKLGFKKIFPLIVLIGLIVGPFLYVTTLGAPDLPRINQLIIASDPRVPIWVTRNREVDSGDYDDKTIGKQAITSSYFFHNKVFSWLDAFANNFAHSFSTDFLIIRGDPNLRHSIGKMGPILFIDFIAFVAGVFWLLKNIKLKHNLFLFAWLLTSPIPASLTMDGAGHSGRLFIFSAPLLLTISLGWWYIINFFKNTFKGKLLLIVVASLWLLLLIFYFHKYFIHYPIESARNFGFGFKEAVGKILEEESKYDKVIMGPGNDPPMIYFLYWSKMSSKVIHEYGTLFSPDIIKNQPLDKFKVAHWSITEELEKETLYLLSTKELSLDLRNPENIPKNMKLIEIIKYPDNEVAFYIVSKKD